MSIDTATDLSTQPMLYVYLVAASRWWPMTGQENTVTAS